MNSLEVKRKIPGLIVLSSIGWIIFGILSLFFGVFSSLKTGTPTVSLILIPLGLFLIYIGVRTIKVWILFGIWVLLLGVFVALKSGNILPPVQLIPISIGLFFIYIGVRTIKGKAKDTLGNSLAVIIFGVYPAINVYVRGGTSEISLLIVFSTITVLSGILSLIGRTEYKKYIAGKNA
jgi:hypothetical protein